MKNSIFRLLSFSVAVLLPLSFTSCWTTIRTVAPTTEVVVPVKTVYTTQVTTPSPKVTTTNTFTVTSYNSDPCFYLDLQAVAAAFAESRNVQEFERLLNSSRYMINNLDLNRDGWIDYLRVLECRQGSYHTFLIQACLAPSVFQDVATLVSERRANALYVEVIGDPYLYGRNYIVRPVFVNRPPMWDTFGYASYNPWSSPYYYGYYPSYYQQPKPVYLNHYQAYVTTYMTNHHYCHHCDYPDQPFYTGYTQATQSHSRHDYEVLHPDNSFEHRVTNTYRSGTTVRNAGQLRAETQRQQQGTTTTTQRQQQGTATASGTTSTRQQGTTATATGTTSTRTSGTTARPAQTTTPATSVSTRVNKSGTTRTTVKQTDASGRTTTVQRTQTPSRSTGTSTRGASTTGTTTRGGSTTTTRPTGSTSTRH